MNKKIGVGQPKRLENAKILVANTAMDTDKVKIYGSRVRVESLSKVAEIEEAEKQRADDARDTRRLVEQLVGLVGNLNSKFERLSADLRAEAVGGDSAAGRTGRSGAMPSGVDEFIGGLGPEVSRGAQASGSNNRAAW